MKGPQFSRKMIPIFCLLTFLLFGLPLAMSSSLLMTSFAASAASQATGGPQPDVIIASRSTTPTCNNAGLCPSLLLTAYNMTSLQSDGVTGAGQTIVIDDACGNPDMASDLSAFDSQFGLAAPPALTIDNPQGKPCTDAGWSLETSLDVEWAHVMAPSASIVLLQAASASDTDLFGAWSYALSNNLGNQISNSWIDYGGGECPSNVVSILQTATTDHVSILAASGDAAAWGYKQPIGDSYPADCIQVLTVGGTTLTIDSKGNYVSESVWSCGFECGTGGGYTSGVKEPSYEKSVKIVEPKPAPKPKLLGKSDVSADANPNTGVWVYNTPDCGGWCVVGGTSVACPLWAGFLGDVNQIRAIDGFSPIGYFSPYLYDTVYGLKGSSSLYAADFHDITSGSNGWPAGKGWDAPTGLGSFIGDNLAEQLGSTSGA
jgi:subtilase family serine protease